jgi:signal peptidase
VSGRRFWRVARGVSAAAIIAAAWLFLAPPQLGGSTRYAIVDGSSMEPALHAGDLALVRSRGDAGVGDVALFRDPELGVHVLHRVIGREDGRLVLKGDANGFVDDPRLRQSDVAGTLWLTVPAAGFVLVWAREPFHAAILAFVLTILLLAGRSSHGSVPREEAAR